MRRIHSYLTNSLRMFTMYALFPITFALALVSVPLISELGGGAFLTGGLIGACILIVVRIFEIVVPFRVDWTKSSGDMLTDIIYVVIGVIFLEATLALLSLVPSYDIWFDNQLMVYQVAIACICGEFGSYWAHRSLHRDPYLWRFHSEHHSPSRVYSINAAREHPLGFMLIHGFWALPLLMMGIDEMALAYSYTLFLVIGTYQHANLDIRIGLLNRVFPMTEVHRWHHNKDSRESDCNHGLILSIWDQVFGTYKLPEEKGPVEVGVEYKGFPMSLYKQIMLPVAWSRYAFKND